MHKALLLLTFLAALGLAGHARADGKVNVLVLRENGGGSAARAQPHLDALITRAASINHWSSAAGKYVTRAAAAEKYIANQIAETKETLFNFFVKHEEKRDNKRKMDRDFLK